MPARRRRCSFKEGGRRCPRDGDGDPPLCRACAVAVAAASRQRSPVEILTGALDNLMSGKAINVEATIGAAAEFYEQWMGSMGGAYRPDVEPGEGEGSAHRRARAGQVPRGWPGGARSAPPPEDPQIAAARAARQVLGFAQAEKLDEAKIKDRKRKLAMRYHPDRGGSAVKMAQVNDAADVLMGTL